jgi:hypothetical protein
MIYWHTYRNWLLKLLNERIYLSGSGYRPDLLDTARELKRLIDYWGYRNDSKLAGFLCRRQNDIEKLIPKNKAYENQINTLRAALAEGKGYLER